MLLKKANKKIADLLEDIRRLSDELRKKETLLTGFVEVASSQSRRLASMSDATQDTILWDPSVDPRRAACSTPCFPSEATWTEVGVRKRKERTINGDSPPRLSVSNRFELLADSENPIVVIPAISPNSSTRQSTHPLVRAAAAAVTFTTTPAAPGQTPTHDDVAFQPASDTTTSTDPQTQDRSASSYTRPSQDGGSYFDPAAAVPPSIRAAATIGRDTTSAADEPQQRSAAAWNKPSSYRRRILRDAVFRRSGDFIHPASVRVGGGGCPHSDLVDQADALPVQSAAGLSPTPSARSPKSPFIPPLFPPSTLIIGDSIIRVGDDQR
ncbi:unnamed protein product [Arctogadus glacialis]